MLDFDCWSNFSFGFLDEFEDDSAFRLRKNEGSIMLLKKLLTFGDSCEMLEFKFSESLVGFLELFMLLLNLKVANDVCGETGEHMRCVLLLELAASEVKTLIEHTLTLYSLLGLRSLRR